MWSVLEDVESFFDVLKGRFRILKLPILYRAKEKVDNVFSACCILHNMLHAFDGLDVLEADVDWAGANGVHDAWVADPLVDVSSTGLRTVHGKADPADAEVSHEEWRQQLMTSCAYREGQDDIVLIEKRK